MTLLTLFACTGSIPPLPPPRQAAPSAFHEQGSGSTVRLEHLAHAATWTLPASNLPPDAAVPGRFPLTGRWKPSGGSVWSHPSPLRLTKKVYTAPPDGMQLLQGERELAWGRGPGQWVLEDGAVLLFGPADPSADPPTLVSPREQVLQSRLNLGSSGLEPATYAPFRATLGPETRGGLLLPAPGSVTFALRLPEGSQLDFGVGIVPREVTDGDGSDGVRLTVEVDGAAVAEVAVAPGAFRDTRLDLSGWGGREVQLTFRSHPGDDASYDHLLVTAPQVWGSPTGPVRRVIVVGIDTLRADALTQHGHPLPLTAALDDLAEQSVVFDAAQTPAPRTRPSFRTSFTGRWPLPAMDAPMMGTVFSRAGWATGGVSANVHLVPRFGFDEGMDWWRYENGADAEVQLRHARAFLERHRDRDAFLFVHLMDPHTFYAAPYPYTNRYVNHEAGPLEARMNRWKVLKLHAEGALTGENRAWLEERYQGEVAYMADELARFLAWALALPGETLLVVHNDHGEEFWDHGSYEHNHALYQEVTRALLWIRPPGGLAGGPTRADDLVGLVDIAPTIYDLAGIEGPPTDGVSLRPFLDTGRAQALVGLRASLRDRALPIGHLMYDREQWAVVARGPNGHRHKYILDTFGGREQLYDLDADPAEVNDLAPGLGPEGLAPWQAALGRATGWPVGRGLRVDLRGRGPFRLAADRPFQVQVIDPEADRPNRANLEWGEVAPVLPEDVAELRPSADRATWQVLPGKAGRGVLAVLADDGGPLELRVEGGEEPVVLSGTVRWGGVTLTGRPGAVILPQDSVRQRLEGQALGAGDASSMEALRSLGYIDGHEH